MRRPETLYNLLYLDYFQKENGTRSKEKHSLTKRADVVINWGDIYCWGNIDPEMIHHFISKAFTSQVETPNPLAISCTTSQAIRKILVDPFTSPTIPHDARQGYSLTTKKTQCSLDKKQNSKAGQGGSETTTTDRVFFVLVSGLPFCNQRRWTLRKTKPKQYENEATFCKSHMDAHGINIRATILWAGFCLRVFSLATAYCTLIDPRLVSACMSTRLPMSMAMFIGSGSVNAAKVAISKVSTTSYHLY